jgi:outer membrane protein assembly factor BamD (BamD/ComL family)
MAITVAGIVVASTRGSWALLATGCASVVAVFVSWPLACHIRALQIASQEQAERALNSLTERLEQFSIMLNLISEQQLLSDRAKAVAFREKDSDALRRAIQDEMYKQNWELAMSLADEMQESFGYRQEADRLRGEIEERHQELIRKQINDTVSIIDRHIRSETWNDALQEAQRIAKLYPNNQQATSLPHEVEKRREAHKRQLVESLHDAAARHDSEGGMEILKRLDTYLTPVEAEQFQEVARNILKEKATVLRSQFSVAVQDHKWSEALRLAETICQDFPSSQMAKEVREMMDSLRARASGLEPAAITS